MAEIDQALVERMVAVVRLAAEGDRGDGFDWKRDVERRRQATAILADLPEQVDPLVLQARQISHDVLMRLGASAEQISAGDIIRGKRDDAIVMHVALEALRARAGGEG